MSLHYYIVIFLFTLWFFVHGMNCPCDKDVKRCYRTEFYGFQYGHFILYVILGAIFPRDFLLWICIGVLWEIFEYWLSSRPDVVRKHGGCLSSYDKHTPLWFKKVHSGELKYENFIDKFFGIQNSSEHTWHFSIGENLTNVVGFLVGKWLSNY